MRIRQTIVDQMTAHALQEMPVECCGLLSGAEGLIDNIRCCENELRSPCEFRVPDRELIEFFRRLREEEREFLGIYHSHPDGSTAPSMRDRKEFHYLEATYWIVSLHNGLASVRCFEWRRMGFVETPYGVER